MTSDFRMNRIPQNLKDGLREHYASHMAWLVAEGITPLHDPEGAEPRRLVWTKLPSWIRGRVPVDLKGADLRRADLSKADFMEANLFAVGLEEADLSGAFFNGSNMEEARLDGADLEDTDFEQANLDFANFGGEK